MPAGRGQTSMQRLYSAAAWPERRSFVGHISVGGSTYDFAYEPSRAEIINKLLRLTGRITVTDAGGRARALDTVRATLANTQGGIGTGPIRPRLITAEAPVDSRGASAGAQLTVTENTGATSYCGVLYFHFEPFDAGALGVRADLTRVQLNVRLEPLDETARTLHGLYCYVVDAVYGERTDEKLAAAAIEALNRVFAG
jgi:hypothetical protein